MPPSSQPSTRPATAGPAGLALARNDDSNWLPKFFAWSLGLHVSIVLALWLIVILAQFFGFSIPLLSMSPKARDTEFVLVDNAPKAPPRKKTRNRAEHASRSGGEKKANQPTQMPQRAAGAQSRKAPAQPSAQPKAATRPQPRPTPRPQPQPQRRPTPQQPQQPRPVAQQQPTPAPQPTPKPTPPAPPAPRVPRPVKAETSPVAPPTRSAPTIRTPAPRNPSAMSGGPVVKTPGSSSGSPSSQSSGGSSGGGNPGPSMIAGNPTRGGGGSPGRTGSSGGGGGAGGAGSYNQSGSPGGGGGRAGVDAEAEPDFGPYIAELQRRIKRNWAPPTEDRNKRVVVIFNIARDGSLISVRLKGTSGSPTADQAAIAAVRLSAPFRNLPSNFKGQSIPVEFTFDYQVLGGNARMR